MSQSIESPLSNVSPADLEAFHRDGYHIARGLFRSDEIDTLRDTFMEQGKHGRIEGLSEMVRLGGQEYSPSDPLRFYPRMMNPHRHADKPVGPLAKRYLLDARVGEILTRLLGEEPIAAQTMFYFKPPGARGQDLHQDNFYLRVKPGTCIAAWTAVDDADEGNGGMMCVPGTGDMEVVCPEKSDSTKFFTSEHVEPPPGKEPLIIRLKAGDVMFFNGSVIHGSMPNLSRDRFRRAFISHYVPASCVEVSSWYRPLLKFDGTDVSKQEAMGGGPCGSVEGGGMTSPH